MTNASKPIVVAISGPSGSGKTELANALLKQINNHHSIELATLLHEDNYYRDQSQLTHAQRENINYDHPDAFDELLLQQHIKALTIGKPIEVPHYNFNTHCRSNKKSVLDPSPIIIIEGILLLARDSLLNEFDLKLYVDTDLDVCLSRRIQRDTLSRGRDLTSVLKQYESTVRPMCKKFILPSKKHADILVPRGGLNTVAINMITTDLIKRLG